jgi:hypothetical protein
MYYYCRSKLLWQQLKNIDASTLRNAILSDIQSSTRPNNYHILPLHEVSSTLYFFCILYSHQLTGIDDEELLESNVTQLATELPDIIFCLKGVLQILYWNDVSAWDPDRDMNTTTSTFALLNLQLAVTRLFNQLFVRNE